MKKFIAVDVPGNDIMAAGPSVRRRALLAGGAGSLAATSGCVGELRNLLGRESTRQLELTILTTPAADDPYAVRVANHLADNLERAGMAAFVDLRSPDVLLRDVLINQDYEIYVTPYPSEGTPDELRTLLHSSYGEEAGWQNPFGFSDLNVDDLLEEQRRVAGEDREAVVGEIQEAVVRTQPFTCVAFRDRITGYRTDRFTRWSVGGPNQLTDYLMLERVGEADTLKMILGDARVTRNRNPIAVEHRSGGHLVDLLYEPLLRTLDSGIEPTPWLARNVEWNEEGALSATVELRETPWHDGEPVTAEDVAFTYEFLNDTSLGEFDSPVPTPWRRGRVSLVESARSIDEATVRLEFATPHPEVAIGALGVPVLPAHVWRERTARADLAGINVGGPTTEAVVWSNEEPVGSGPLRFEEAAPDQRVVFAAFEDHFLETGDVEGIPETLAGGLPFERAVFRVAPSHDAAVQLLESDEADASADGLSASVVPRIGRNEALSLTIDRSDDFYHVGYNCRNAPLSDPNFRRVLARLLDREYLVSDAFGDFAAPTETPLQDPWTPEHLAWDGEATLGFFGDGGDPDVEVAREAFREAGYNYEDEQLVRRGAA
jgi:peptide/nickel transport system substrate-binding protein